MPQTSPLAVLYHIYYYYYYSYLLFLVVVLLLLLSILGLLLLPLLLLCMPADLFLCHAVCFRSYLISYLIVIPIHTYS